MRRQRLASWCARAGTCRRSRGAVRRAVLYLRRVLSACATAARGRELQFVIYGEEASADALKRVYERTGRSYFALGLLACYFASV